MRNKNFFFGVALMGVLLSMPLMEADAQNSGGKRARSRVATSSAIAQSEGDMSAIRQTVKTKFAVWSEKGEFEKASAVDERLRTGSKMAFDKICFDVILEQVSRKARLVSSSERKISTYDSEKEAFIITIPIFGVQRQFTLNVPINVAPQFKTDFASLSLSCGFSWGILEGKLYPKTLKIADYDIGFSSEIPIMPDGLKDIEVPFDGLGISNSYLSGYVFSLNDYMQQYTELQKEFNFQQDNSKIFDVVEEMPSYPGGMGAMMSFISSNVKFPDGDYCAQGRVIVSFVVERDGSLSNIKILRSVEELLDKEAIRVVKSMPKWKPGRQYGKVVRCKYTVPVVFRLQ